MIPGIDVSYWQGLWDWSISAEKGIKFAFIRAGSISTGGVLYEDYLFRENAEEAPKHMPVGFYWYFRPNHDPTKQADFFCDLILNEDWLLPPVLDIESSGGLSAAAVGDRCAEFIAKVYERTTVWPIIYTRGYFWNDRVDYRSIFDECDLWVARYTSQPKPWDNPGDNPKLKPDYWMDWTFWQWIADSNKAVELGGAGPPSGDDDVDLNWFNGNEAAFDEYIGAPPATQLPDDVMVRVTVEIGGEVGKYKGRAIKEV